MDGWVTSGDLGGYYTCGVTGATSQEGTAAFTPSAPGRPEAGGRSLEGEGQRPQRGLVIQALAAVGERVHWRRQRRWW